VSGVAYYTVERDGQQHRRLSRLKDPRDRLGAGRRGLRRGPERLDPLVSRELTGDVDPWRLATLARVPRVGRDASQGSP
jgi:hypothetical protein